MASISENYKALQMTWDEAKQATKETEKKIQIMGIAAQMEIFKYFFGLELGRKCFSIVDNLSRSLQRSTMSAREGQDTVKLSVKTLQSMRSEEQFNLFWKYVEVRSSKVDISTPALPGVGECHSAMKKVNLFLNIQARWKITTGESILKRLIS